MGKFNSLILDTYKEWRNPKRVFIKNESGIEVKYNNFYGVIYGAISRDSFMDIQNIGKYIKYSYPDMLTLESRVTGQEIEIYKWNLEDYKIVENELVIHLKNGVVNFQM